MKVQSLTRSFMQFALCCALVLTTAFIGGCKGSSGSDGAAGPAGPAGGTGTTTAAAFGTHSLSQGAVDATISNVVVSATGDGKPMVSFKVATASGPYTALTATQIRVYLADLVPAGTPTGAAGTTYPSDYFEQWASETVSTLTSTYGAAIFNNSDAANGNYSWTFSAAFGTATPGSGLNNVDYKATDVQRLVLRISGDTTILNTVATQDFNVPAPGANATTLDSQKVVVTIEACQKCHSKYMDNAAHANGYLDTKACDICHSPLYGSSRHAAGFMDTDNTVLPVFIHQIHASKYTKVANLVGQPVTFPNYIQNCAACHTNSGQTLGTGDKVDNWKNKPSRRACGSCHDTADFATGATFTGLDGVSKHHSVQTTDNGCTACHTASGSGSPDIVSVHDTTLPKFVDAATTPDSPEYNVAISLSTPANGKYFVTGETPTVTITLTNNDAAGSAVASTLTSTGGHTPGTFDPGSLSIANMYVYGPRSSPRPSFIPAGAVQTSYKTSQTTGLLTGGTQTATFIKSINLMNTYWSASRVAGVAPQPQTPGASNSVVDPNKTPTATGWTYTLAPIPASALPGTYFVRIYLGNHYVFNVKDNTPPNQNVSIGLAKFQVGTATEDKRIAGNADGTSVCLNCHGNTIAHRDDHAAPYDPDHCNACHYVGMLGNTAATTPTNAPGTGVGLGDGSVGATGLGKTAPISNRVHAVHSNSAAGDISVIDWSEADALWIEAAGTSSAQTATITYPSNIKRCSVCHASGNTSYMSNLYTVPCYGCHADVTGATAHFKSMGGSIASMVSSSTVSTGANNVESCVVCHGAGKAADISDK